MKYIMPRQARHAGLSSIGGKFLDTSGVNNVMEVDVERGVAVVEPNISSERLVSPTRSMAWSGLS